MIRDYRRLEKDEELRVTLLPRQQQQQQGIQLLMNNTSGLVEDMKGGRTRRGSLGKLLPRRLSRNVMDLFNQQTK